MPTCHDHLPPIDLDRVSAVSILAGEHRVILQTLACLERIAARAVEHDSIPAAHAGQALEILRRFADQCHHSKEEEILFPALEAKVPGFGPTRVMRDEHVTGRAHIADMARALTGDDAGRFAAQATAYVVLLRAHIEKEDEILFRMAQQLLDAEEDARLLDAYRAVEHEDMGDGTHERLLAQADALAAAYDVPRASAEPRIMHLLTAVCGCHRDDGAPAAPPIWREGARELRYLAEKVARVHGDTHPEVAVLAEVVASLADDSGDLAAARALLPRLRQLTDDFRPWRGSCASVWQLFTGLEQVAVHIPDAEG